MPSTLVRCLAVLLLLAAASPAHALFHLWVITEIYSNGDGTVQFIELRSAFGSQQFVSNHAFTTTSGATTQTLTLTTDLPGDSANKRFLVATPGFAAVAGVTPDYVMPAGFLPVGGGTLNWASSDIWTYGALPGGDLSLERDVGTGTPAVNSPTNFAGVAGHVVLPSIPPGVVSALPATLDFGGQSMATTSPGLAVTVGNGSNAPVSVGPISLGGAQYTHVNDCPGTLAAGATCTVTVRFSPAIGAGAALASVVVADTLTIATGGGTKTVALTGNAEKSLVTQFYRAILNRAPDGPGKAFWESEAARVGTLGVDINETWYVMSGYFFNSPEYAAQGKSDAAFVTDLYNTFFNRAPDSAGLAFWTGQIAGGLPREVVLFSFMFSTEFKTFSQAIFGNTAARAEVNVVVDFFRGILNRLPDSSSFQFWLGRMRTAQCTGAAAVQAEVDFSSVNFIAGAEYVNRARTTTQFVTDMYYSFLRRGGDAAGVQFWVGEVQAGRLTLDQVRAAFIASPEFTARANAVVAQGCALTP